MVLRELGGRARGGSPPQEKLLPSAPEIFLDVVGGASAPKVILAPPVASSLPAPAAGGFDIAAIRPALEASAFTPERSPHSANRPWEAAISAALHVAALAVLLTWATPAVETAPPEPVTIDIVPDMPTSVVRESQPLLTPPPAAETRPSPPLVEPSPPPVVEPAPPAAEAPPPPPVAEPSPPPVAEAPPPPPVVEPSPPPVAEAPPPKPVVEPTPRPSPLASPAPPRVPKPMPTAASPATARVAKPPPSERPTPPRVAKPTPPQKMSPRNSREPPESSRSASRATKLASLPPQSAPAASSAEVAAYQGEVLGRIAAQKRYPEAARERAPQGVAIIRFSIAASGQLAGASLSRSAGDPLLDAEALATVRRASPFPPPPAGAPRNFSVPLSYRVQ